MGLLDKIFNKNAEKKETREVGSNFDKSEADEIFDALDKINTDNNRKISKNMKRELDQTKEVSELLKQAKSLEKSKNFDEAIALYEKVLVILPETGVSYEGLATIYR